MGDVFTKKKRSEIMSHIPSKDTKPELLVRNFLFRKGFRYRKNDKRYAGTPDIVLPKYNTVIFVHGCFWPQHSGCKYANVPKTNTAYWTDKLSRNVKRDALNVNKLENLGFHVIIIWECELKNDADKVLTDLVEQLNQNLKSN